MSKATKRKFVTSEVQDTFIIPEGDQMIVKVTAGRGNNLHEVETTGGERFLVSMPTKFRKNVWIKRGNYLIVEPIEEGNKVRAEIIQILYKEQIRYLQAEKQWPAAFESEFVKRTDELIPSDMLPPSSDSEEEDEDEEEEDENDEEEETEDSSLQQ